MPLKHITTFQLFGLKVIDIYWSVGRSEINIKYLVSSKAKKNCRFGCRRNHCMFYLGKVFISLLANSQASFVKLILSPIGHCLSSFVFGKNSQKNISPINDDTQICLWKSIDSAAFAEERRNWDTTELLYTVF